MASVSPRPTMMVPPGGIPNNTDTILSGIFIGLFFISGLYFHFRIFQTYKRKFIWSILCFGFCMARIAALTFRIVVVKHPTSKALNIVAQVLIAAGVILLFFVNLQMSRRFFGQLHPQHSIIVKRVITAVSSLIIPLLAMVITTVIQSFITKDPHILSIDRTVRLVGIVFFVFFAFFPIPIVLLVLVLKAMGPGGFNAPQQLGEQSDDEEAMTGERKKANGEVTGQTGENGATGENPKSKTVGGGVVPTKTSELHDQPRFRGEPKTGYGPVPVTSREIIETALFILIPGILLTFEQIVRCAQSFYEPKPGAKTPWYMTKAAFWVCIFGFELLSVIIFGIAVLPRRFSHLRTL